MNTFRLEVTRALGSREFVLAAAGFVLSGLLGSWRMILGGFTGGLQEPGYMLSCCEESLSSRYLLLALPVFAALPFAGSFVEDAQSRFLRSYLPRCGRQPFLLGRAGATALSGGLVMVAGSAACCALLSILLLPREMRPDPLTMADTEALRMTLIAALLRKTAQLALSGSLWALVGALAAALTMNRHLAVAVPFVLFYLLVILSTRYFPDLQVLNPEEWIDASGVWAPVPLAAAGFVLELILAAGAALITLMSRRLRDV